MLFTRYVEIGRVALIISFFRLVVGKLGFLWLSGITGSIACNWSSSSHKNQCQDHPRQVRELAEKEPDNGVFRMPRSDITRFLTTILIGTTVVNIAATALVTEPATAIFGEAGISAATGVMTVAILLITEITPKSIAVHHATDVARVVVRPVAWLSVILYLVGRIATFLSFGMLKMLGFKGRRFDGVTKGRHCYRAGLCCKCSKCSKCSDRNVGILKRFCC